MSVERDVFLEGRELLFGRSGPLRGGAGYFHGKEGLYAVEHAFFGRSGRYAVELGIFMRKQALTR